MRQTPGPWRSVWSDDRKRMRGYVSSRRSKLKRKMKIRINGDGRVQSGPSSQLESWTVSFGKMRGKTEEAPPTAVESILGNANASQQDETSILLGPLDTLDCFAWRQPVARPKNRKRLDPSKVSGALVSLLIGVEVAV